MDENKKRELIKKIKENPSLTEQEKTKKIQQLFTSNYISALNTRPNYNHICLHYNKNCSQFKFECCGLIDPCKRCHAERNCCDLKNIKVFQITCNLCGIKQEPSQYCSNSKCCLKFSESYCKKCQIWTDKEIHHCEKCGICRIGNVQKLYHCDTCGICFDKSIEHVHKCIENNGKINKWSEGFCVICSDSTFNSQSSSFQLPCYHFIHKNCFDQYIRQSNYKCPYCKKSICDLSEHWNFIRSQIKLYPILNEMIPIELSDIVNTQFGKFRVLSINIINETKLFSGEFIDWFTDIKKKQTVKATLNYTKVKKKYL